MDEEEQNAWEGIVYETALEFGKKIYRRAKEESTEREYGKEQKVLLVGSDRARVIAAACERKLTKE